MNPRPSRRLSVLVLGGLAIGPMIASPSGRQAPFDVVLAGGRVMDPASGLDAVRSVGIRDGRVDAIGAGPFTGRSVVDVSGLVVAPGFIDLHQHAQDLAHSRWQVQDGVTTALEMEIGVLPVAEWYAARDGKSLNHYGATVGHISARTLVKTGASTLAAIAAVRDKGSTGTPAAWSHEVATADEIDAMLKAVDGGLDAGALGLGLGINYTPGSSREEILRLFQLAARRGVPVYVHIRSMGRIEPGGSIDSLQEVLENAAATGASLRVVHLGSMGLSQAPILLDMIRGARGRGLDVTTEVTPPARPFCSRRSSTTAGSSDWASPSGTSSGARPANGSIARASRAGGARAGWSSST